MRFLAACRGRSERGDVTYCARTSGLHRRLAGLSWRPERCDHTGPVPSVATTGAWQHCRGARARRLNALIPMSLLRIAPSSSSARPLSSAWPPHTRCWRPRRAIGLSANLDAADTNAGREVAGTRAGRVVSCQATRRRLVAVRPTRGVGLLDGRNDGSTGLARTSSWQQLRGGPGCMPSMGFRRRRAPAAGSPDPGSPGRAGGPAGVAGSGGYCGGPAASRMLVVVCWPAGLTQVTVMVSPGR